MTTNPKRMDKCNLVNVKRKNKLTYFIVNQIKNHVLYFDSPCTESKAFWHVEELCSSTYVTKLYSILNINLVSYNKEKNTGSAKLGKYKSSQSSFGKGITQIDYIVAVGVFILVFALAVQFVSNYFSNIGEKTTIRVITDEARQLLDIIERGPEPSSWPYDTQNNSLILEIHLDNSTLDSSQYGNNGTIQGSVNGGANCSAAVVGRLDSGCSFDGVDDYIDCGADASLNITGNLTLMAWVNINLNNASSFDIISKSVFGDSYRLSKGDSPTEFLFALNTGGYIELYGNISPNVGQWYHVAATYDGSFMRIYVNGQQQNTTAKTGNIITSSTKCAIGAVNGGASNFWPGSIDEVLIYNRSLSANEVYNHYAYENLLDKIGLQNNAYEFYIIVNNTLQYARNQTAPVVSIVSEKVSFNYTDLGYGANVPSTAIYEDNGSVVPYSISGNTITFSTQISSGTAKYFTVFFDDDSNFAERTSTITGVDNLTESIGHIDKLPVIQYRKLLLLNNSNYFTVKNATGLPRDFEIKLIDTGTSVNIIDFGATPPPNGNVVAFQRYGIYQNSTGAIRRGKLLIQSW